MVDDTGDQRRQIAELEERIAELAEQPHDTEDQLSAARAANREPMAETKSKLDRSKQRNRLR